MDAVLELKHYSTERLLDLWEMTTTNSDHNIPAVRGWLMLNQFEPKLGNAVSHIFGPSYEYTRAYREFKKEVARLGCC